MGQQQLSDLVRGIHHAAESTQALLFNQFLQLVESFFDKDEKTGRLKAKTVDIEANGHVFEVPTVALVRPSGLLLKKMEVDLSVRFDEAELKEAKSSLHKGDATRSSFKVSFSPKSDGMRVGRSSDTTDIKLVFEADEPPEGVMRLIDQYTNLIQPRKIEKKGE